MDERLTMAPPPPLIISGMAYLLVSIMLLRLTSAPRPQSSAFTSTTRLVHECRRYSPGCPVAHTAISRFRPFPGSPRGWSHRPRTPMRRPLLADGREGLLRMLGDAIHQEHPGALAGEEHGDGLARADSWPTGPGTGHDRHLSFQPRLSFRHNVLLSLRPIDLPGMCSLARRAESGVREVSAPRGTPCAVPTVGHGRAAGIRAVTAVSAGVAGAVAPRPPPPTPPPLEAAKTSSPSTGTTRWRQKTP